jgi:type IV pilus assembly protein PilW
MQSTNGLFAMTVNRLKRQHTLPDRQKGLTLIEIMIALLLGAVLLAGVIQVFLNTKQTYKMQEALSRLQENGRFAMDFLGRDIRMADYRGCTTASLLLNPGTGDKWGVTGTEGAPNAANHALDAADSITVRWSDVPPCLNPTATKVYTIANGLQQATNGAASVQMIEGVENMQITYGIDDAGDGSANYYTDAGALTATQMGQVVSVRVSLLLATIDDNLTAAPLAYTYNGVTTTPADFKIRRVFNSTFTLRNRLQ